MNTPERFAKGVVAESVSTTELHDVISGACSQDPNLVQSSTKRLKAMLDMFGTYDGLHEIAAQKSAPLVIRQQAIIQFKNAALGHWKSRKVISEEQRIRIRYRTLSFLDEFDETIADCNKISVSKIARLDYPEHWPTLLNDLMTVIDANLSKRYLSGDDNPRENLMLRRSLEILNAVLKEFSNMRMLQGMRTMAAVSEQLKGVLFSYYSKVSPLLSSLNPENINSSCTHDDIVLAHLVYKSLVKIATWLWNRIDKMSSEEHQKNQTWIQEVFQCSAIQLQALAIRRRDIALALSQSSNKSDQALNSISVFTRHIRVFGKFFRRLQQLSHVRFISLPMCGDLVLFYWSQVVEATGGPAEAIDDTSIALYNLRFLVQGMVLFKESLSQWTPLKRNGTTNKDSLSREFVENAVQLLVIRFIPLNTHDLEDWSNDPEEWVNSEEKENDHWEYKIRACSERVLMQLATQFPEFVTPLLQTTFGQIAPQRAEDLHSIVQKEALYCAVGSCAIRLKDKIPFDEWLEHTLLPEVQDTNTNYPIIKRRIAWLVGKWISESCASPNNPKIWQLLVHLLRDRNSGTDIAVRLTAAMAIKACVHTVGFDPNVLEPLLPVAVSELVRLIGEVESMETKRHVDECLNIVIEQAGPIMVSYIPMITDPLPHLWSSAKGDWLFKASLLVTVRKLIEAVKQESMVLGAIVVPLVKESLIAEFAALLDEDGVNLWLAALRNTVTIASVNGAPGLSELFPQGLASLSINLDLLGMLVNIIESYFLLDSTSILQAFGADLFSAFLAAMKQQPMTTNLKDLIGALSLLTQLASPPLWGEPLHSSGLFAYMITEIIDGEINIMISTELIKFFARVVIADRQMFIQLMSATASALKQKEEYLYNHLLDQWWGKFDNMSEPRDRKLSAMGIASLVATGHPEVLKRLSGEIFNLWLDVFGEIKEVQSRQSDETEGVDDNYNSIGPSSLKRFWELDDAPQQFYRGSEGTCEFERRKAVYDQDPVRTTQLSLYVGGQLTAAEAVCGPQDFQSHISTADPRVLSQIMKEVLQR